MNVFIRCWGLFFLLIPYCLFAQTGAEPIDTLPTIIITGNKLKEKRTEAPIAIAIVSSKQIQATNATRIDHLLNTISGVYMPSIGGEQHMMSIRQPISLKGLYLYLEDGLPIRTSGLFSSNALIEINQSNIHSIEIIKGPASALYGAEAIGGVVNFLSAPSPIKTEFSINTQINSSGLKKMDWHFANPLQKNGWQMNASIIDQQDGILTYSDYQKKTISIKKQMHFAKNISGYQSIHWIQYASQMTGSVDSIHFAHKDINSQQSFTNRKINLVRWRQNISIQWNQKTNTSINLMYRSNTMDQNPTYAIASTSNPIQFKGQVNSNHFDAYIIDLQHVFNMPAIATKLIVGGYMDFTKQNFIAHYIDITKDSLLNKFTSFSFRQPDSLVGYYKTTIANNALYLNAVSSLGKKIKINAALRLDQFKYDFKNQLPNGTPTSLNRFQNWTPKIGFTYNKKYWGTYANYSLGFVPPQITEMYNAIRVPYLLPQNFKNKEVGGWFQIAKIKGEISLYALHGENEIISVRQTDGVNLNQNTGKTIHKGVEWQTNFPVNSLIQIYLNGTFANHQFDKTIIKGVDVSGKAMPAAPRFTNNISIHWSPLKNMLLMGEWIHQSNYYMDELNASAYPGFNVFNLRANYQIGKQTIWLHILNASNTYYATMATKNFSVKGNAAYSYYIGEPRSIAIGWKWAIR